MARPEARRVSLGSLARSNGPNRLGLLLRLWRRQNSTLQVQTGSGRSNATRRLKRAAVSSCWLAADHFPLPRAPFEAASLGPTVSAAVASLRPGLGSGGGFVVLRHHSELRPSVIKWQTQFNNSYSLACLLEPLCGLHDFQRQRFRSQHGLVGWLGAALWGHFQPGLYRSGSGDPPPPSLLPA